MSSSPLPFPAGFASDTPSVTSGESGVIAGLVFRNFVNGETINVTPVSYAELRRITSQDGQAKGLLRLLTMPIANAKWDLLTQEEDSAVTSGKPVEKVVGTKSSSERDFIHRNLFQVHAEGGMTVPFEDVIAIMALAIRDGFKVFEKVFDINERGQLYLRKLGYRDNDSVTLLADDKGDYNGFRQRVYFSGKLVDVTLPREKTLIYTFGKEESPLYGSPVFLPVYYHMDKKHKLYYISHVAYQQLAIPPRVGTIPGQYSADTNFKAKFLKDLAGLGFNAAMTVPEGCLVEPFESRRSLADFIPLIDHHNTMAAKSVLGQFMDLSRSSTGRLAGEQEDIFIMGIVSVLRDIEKLFNNWLIPQLIDFNFSSRSYPKLRARAFTDSDQQALANVFQDIMTATNPHVSPEFMANVEKKMASRLDIKDLDYDEIEARMVKDDRAKKEVELNPPQPSGAPTGNSNGKGRKNTKETKGKGSGKEGNA